MQKKWLKNKIQELMMTKFLILRYLLKRAQIQLQMRYVLLNRNLRNLLKVYLEIKRIIWKAVKKCHHNKVLLNIRIKISLILTAIKIIKNCTLDKKWCDHKTIKMCNQKFKLERQEENKFNKFGMTILKLSNKRKTSKLWKKSKNKEKWRNKKSLL